MYLSIIKVLFDRKYLLLSIPFLFIVYINLYNQNRYSGLISLITILTIIIYLKTIHLKDKIKLLSLEAKKSIDQERSALAKFDKDFNITYATKKFVDMIGISEGNIIEIYQNCSNKEDIYNEIKSSLVNGLSYNNMIELNHAKKRVYIDTFIRKLDNATISKHKYIMLCKDITSYIESELEIKNQLFIDKLTSLPNRMKYFEDLKEFNIQKSNHAHTMIYIQLENYEEINEFFGIESGFEMLKKFSLWLKSNLPTNKAKLYKFEHNTFAIYIPNRCSLTDLEEYLKSLNSKINKEFLTINGTNHDISLRIGIARGKKNLLKNSYLAIQEAKKENRTYIIYNKRNDQEERFLSNIQKNKEIKEALNQDRIIPFFQPILNIKTEEIEKFETLMRIQNKDNSHQSPASFLDIAKKSRLYPELSKAIISASLKRLELLQKPITINISIEDILNPKTSSFILRKLKRFHKPDLITFEILENEGIQNYKKVANFIKKIKSFGCKVAIDDFGSGYSNFEQILKLDIDYIKIDGSLIKDILTNKENEIIIKTIINFAKELKVETIAEFVSSKEIFEKVKSLGIDYAQGYYIGKPAPIKLS